MNSGYRCLERQRCLAEYGKDADTARLQGEVLTGKSVSQSYICYKIYSCLRTVYNGCSPFYGICLQTP